MVVFVRLPRDGVAVQALCVAAQVDTTLQPQSMHGWDGDITVLPDALRPAGVPVITIRKPGGTGGLLELTLGLEGGTRAVLRQEMQQAAVYVVRRGL